MAAGTCLSAGVNPLSADVMCSRARVNLHSEVFSAEIVDLLVTPLKSFPCAVGTPLNGAIQEWCR